MYKSNRARTRDLLLEYNSYIIPAQIILYDIDVINSKEIDKQLSLTLKNLIKDGITSKNMKLIDYETIVMDPAYVHINTNTNRKIDRLMTKFNGYNIYSIGRYGAWIYNSMEDSMVAAKELATRLEKNL